MNLTPLGAQVLTMGAELRQAHGRKLLGGGDISDYITGMCFNAVTYMRILLGSKITPTDIFEVKSANWPAKLHFTPGTAWDGKVTLPLGAAIGFYRVINRTWFHVAIATGGSRVRAVNGHRLGNGWRAADLKTVLGQADADKQFVYDSTKITVHVSTF